MATPEDSKPQGSSQDAPFPLTAIDRELLSMTDEQFTPISWPMLKTYIGTHQLEELKRYPSQLRLYMAWTRDVKANYGSVTNFILHERVKWTPLPSSSSADPGSAPQFECRSSTPFEDPADFKVLVNDWPYGFEEGITHLVVWSKVPIPADAEMGKITDEGAELIQDFVERHFVRALRNVGILSADEEAQEKVLWFKNWIRLQSVRAIEHAHVLVRDVDKDLLATLCSE